MSRLVAVFGRLAGNGRLILILGLLIGVAMPQVALMLRGWLPELVALLLFVAALRIGPRQALGLPGDLKPILALVLVFQVLLPILLVGVLRALGISGPIATGLVLMAAASPISGSPNLTLLTGNDPAPSLRLLIAGTALLPLTVVPVFWLTPALGSAASILSAAIRLLAIIASAAVLAFGIRASVLRDPEASTLRAVDGLSALLMGILVIGLMSAVGPALRGDREQLAVNLAAAVAINFGLQIVTALALRGKRWSVSRAAVAIGAGNRNMALFLAALPRETTDPLLIFIGCYQVPMYLTPLVLGRLYRRRKPRSPTEERD